MHETIRRFKFKTKQPIARGIIKLAKITDIKVVYPVLLSYDINTIIIMA